MIMVCTYTRYNTYCTKILQVRVVIQRVPYNTIVHFYARLAHIFYYCQGPGAILAFNFGTAVHRIFIVFTIHSCGLVNR